MSEFYKVLKADPLGEPWTPNKPGAKPIQNYWCQVEGQDWAVSIGRQVDNPLHAGTHVYGDLVYSKSQKGTEYWKFKSQQVPEGTPRPTDAPSTPAQATAQAATNVSQQVPGWAVPLYNMVEYIYKQMKQMEIPSEANHDVAAEEQVETGIDPATKAALDSIFSPETPEDK